MILSAIAAIGSIAGAVTGGVMAAKANKQRREALEESERNLEDWYNREYNADPMKRAGAQRMMNKTSEALNKLYDKTKGSAMVSGDTGGQMNKFYDASAEALGNVAGKIVENNEARRDQISQQYMAQKAKLDNTKAEYAAQNQQALGQAISGAISSVSSGIGGMAGAYKDWKASMVANAPTATEQIAKPNGQEHQIVDPATQMPEGVDNKNLYQNYLS